MSSGILISGIYGSGDWWGDGGTRELCAGSGSGGEELSTCVLFRALCGRLGWAEIKACRECVAGRGYLSGALWSWM